MFRKQFAGSVVAVAGLALATACDNGDIVSAPRAGAPTIGHMAPSFDSAPAAGPGPMLSAFAANVCADVSGGSQEPGATVVAWACHGGANQQFALQASGAITVYDGTKCLDIVGGSANDGDPVVTWACHGGAN